MEFIDTKIFIMYGFQQRRESLCQIRGVLYLSLFCVNKWEEAKYFIIFRYWQKPKIIRYWLKPKIIRYWL
jgi:hypothetical protein